jgi:hypothetical protein
VQITCALNEKEASYKWHHGIHLENLTPGAPNAIDVVFMIEFAVVSVISTVD